MPKKPVITVVSIQELCVYGKDLRRIRYQNKLTLEKVCESINLLGYAYYPVKLHRLEHQVKI